MLLYVPGRSELKCSKDWATAGLVQLAVHASSYLPSPRS